MGVRGLTSFIAKDEKRYLKPAQLHDTTVVIDGNCIASHLYQWVSKRDSAFGGDYHEFYCVVQRFFQLLKKCKITPIVLFDGGYENKKIPTVLSRLKTKLKTLKRSFSDSFSRTKFFPLFLKQTFLEVCHHLNIEVIQTEYEADDEIACLARSLQCPVISYDSDFYIYDVLYIPFNSVELEALSALVERNEAKKHVLRCSIYDVNTFLSEFPGLRKCHLPIIATLLGNDYVDHHAFEKFFRQIQMSQRKNCSRLHGKIGSVLIWLSRESESSAIQKILSHLPSKIRETLSSHLESTRKAYSINERYKDRNVREISIKISILNERLSKSFSQCKLPSWIVDMVSLNVYFTALQIEDCKQDSAHVPSLLIISKIYSLLCSYLTVFNQLKVYIRKPRTMTLDIITVDSECLDISDLKTRSAKRRFFFEALALEEDDISIINAISGECQLFFCCFIVWCKALRPSNTQFHALLLSYIGCQANRRVGMCRVNKESLLTEDDVMKFIAELPSYKKAREYAEDYFSVKIIHVYSIFQSLLYHSCVLNSLLECPVEPIKIADTLCGSLTFSIYCEIMESGCFTNYLARNFVAAPKIMEMYSGLFEKLQRYISDNPDVEHGKKKKTVKRKSKHKKPGKLEEPAVVIAATSDDEAYDGASNMFSLLRIQNEL